MAAALAKGLRQNKVLEELDLSHNKMQPGGAVLLCAAVGASSSLRMVDLSWNHLRREGGMAMALALGCRAPHSSLLTELGSALPLF